MTQPGIKYPKVILYDQFWKLDLNVYGCLSIFTSYVFGFASSAVVYKKLHK